MNLPYGLFRVEHSGQKSGDAGNQWSGKLVFQTERSIRDEIEAERNLEALLNRGEIPVFGDTPRLRGITFRWRETDAETDLPVAACTVTIEYLSYVEWMSKDDADTRVEVLKLGSQEPPKTP